MREAMFNKDGITDTDGMTHNFNAATCIAYRMGPDGVALGIASATAGHDIESPELKI